MEWTSAPARLRLTAPREADPTRRRETLPCPFRRAVHSCSAPTRIESPSNDHIRSWNPGVKPATSYVVGLNNDDLVGADGLEPPTSCL